MRDLSVVTVFALGMAAGGVVAWYVSQAVERFRRARLDWRTSVAGRKTLIQMMWRRGMSATTWGAFGLGVLVAVIFVMWRSNA